MPIEQPRQPNPEGVEAEEEKMQELDSAQEQLNQRLEELRRRCATGDKSAQQKLNSVLEKLREVNSALESDQVAPVDESSEPEKSENSGEVLEQSRERYATLCARVESLQEQLRIDIEASPELKPWTEAIGQINEIITASPHPDMAKVFQADISQCLFSETEHRKKIVDENFAKSSGGEVPTEQIEQLDSSISRFEEEIKNVEEIKTSGELVERMIKMMEGRIVQYLNQFYQDCRAGEIDDSIKERMRSILDKVDIIHMDIILGQTYFDHIYHFAIGADQDNQFERMTILRVTQEGFTRKSTFNTIQRAGIITNAI